MVEPNRSESRRGRAIETAVLALVAVVPMVPYLVFLLREGVGRFALAGDFALLEQATRRVWSGDTLLGPYSRFRWHHPGPLFFYVAAPFSSAFRGVSTGLFIGTWAINASAAAMLVASLRVCATRAHALAGLVVVLGWLAAFGNVVANPWNPLVIVLPLMAFLVLASLVARGDLRPAIPAVFFGLIAALTHVAAVPIVSVAGLASLIAFAFGWRARPLPRTSAAERWYLAIAAGLVLLSLLPPIVEQLTAVHGNIGLVARFFLAPGPPATMIKVALDDAATALSWLPDRLLHGALSEEGWVALGMRWDALPAHLSKTARSTAIIHSSLLALALIVARLRRDSVSLALLVFGVLGELVALSALQRIVGEHFYYLVFWTTAASSVAWMGVWCTSFALASTFRPRRAIAGALLLAVLALAVVATSQQRSWLERNPAIPGSYPGMRPELGALYAALRARLAREGATPVVHLDGAYDLAQALVLELERDAVDVRVPEAERWNYAGVRSPIGVARPLDIWCARSEAEVPRGPCVELVAEAGSLRVYAGEGDPARCPR